MNRAILRSLAPEGYLRAAINLSNFLLVPRVMPDGTPTGTSPDVATRIARALDVECKFVCFERPGFIADAVDFDQLGDAIAAQVEGVQQRQGSKVRLFRWGSKLGP